VSNPEDAKKKESALDCELGGHVHLPAVQVTALDVTCSSRSSSLAAAIFLWAPGLNLYW
jgi:hypothetical protein